MQALTARPGIMGDAELEIVERHRRGDPSAFQEIYERYGAMVFNLALQMTGEREEASDISQETFLRIHRHLAGFRGRSSLRTWVYRVTVNCCRSRYRRQRWWKRRLLQDSEARLERVPDGRRSPEDRAMARGTTELVAGALQRLPAVYREAVALRDIEGLSYEEIARICGVRIGTIRSRIARGRDRLRAVLEDEESWHI